MRRPRGGLLGHASPTWARSPAGLARDHLVHDDAIKKGFEVELTVSGLGAGRACGVGKRRCGRAREHALSEPPSMGCG